MEGSTCGRASNPSVRPEQCRSLAFSNPQVARYAFQDEQATTGSALFIEAVADWENLFQAAAKARRGKSRRPDVETWWLRRETELACLREELLGGSWRPAAYRIFTIHEPKRRQIAAAPFGDRVVTTRLIVIQPVLERGFIARSYSCQVGKGTTAARECCRELTNRFGFVLKCDVAKSFPTLTMNC